MKDWDRAFTEAVIQFSNLIAGLFAEAMEYGIKETKAMLNVYGKYGVLGQTENLMDRIQEARVFVGEEETSVVPRRDGPAH